MFYKLAVQVDCEMGQPVNQLGVVAEHESNSLEALEMYLRR